MTDPRSPDAPAEPTRPQKPQPRSQNDLFIDEVTEEIRRERLMDFGRKYGPFIGAALLAIVLGVGIYEYQRYVATEAARALGGQLIDVAREADDDMAAAAARFEEIRGEAGSAEAQAVAALLAADARVEAGDQDGARALFDEIAAVADLSPLYRHLAILKAAMMDSDAADPAELSEALSPLTEAGAPYRALALEQIGLAQLRAGNISEGRDALAEASADALASNLLRERVRLILEATPGAPSADAAEAEGAEQTAAEENE